MKCKNCYSTVADFLEKKDAEIRQLNSTIERMNETAKEASLKAAEDNKRILELLKKIEKLESETTYSSTGESNWD